CYKTIVIIDMYMIYLYVWCRKNVVY
ncbi:unnamed protein product, partial [Rotaria socialis]